ncbi:MAG: AMP-binding protein [Alphaproteobacteria bacterium]|nr:AMP-binding protein [Alphaproteobacteria bacterium]
MNIASLFVRNGRTLADLPAVAAGDSVYLSHGQLLARAARIAGHLRGKLGLNVGDRAALVMKNCPAYLELLVAGWYAGLTMVPVNAKLHQREFAYILDHSGARICFATPDLIEVTAPLADEIPTLEQVIDVGVGSADRLDQGDPIAMVDVPSAAVAWLFYTSGTTGRPKGAMLTHRNLLAMTLSYFIDVDQVAPQDVILHAAPMSHGSGCYILPHAAAGACQIIPESGGFDPAEMAGLFKVHQGVTVFAAPTMVKRMSGHQAMAGSDHPGLKTVVYGGGPMYLADLQKAHEVFGFRLAQIYGQGESPMCITALDKRAHGDTGHPRYLERLQSAGKVQTVMQMRVVDAEGRALPSHGIGEVVAKGDAVMAGYWRDEAATAAAIKDGWLHTGDVGSLDEDGFLTLRDRSKDLIISGGANIYPREVEEVLLRHPDVAEVSVIGQKDEEWGEVVVAFAVAIGGVTLEVEALDRFCLEHIARFKRPKRYHLVEALPKNNYGKVLKTELRARLAENG